MIEGWQGATLTRDKIPAARHAVYVYSDIEMAMGMPFATAYGDPYTIHRQRAAKAMSGHFPDADPASRTMRRPYAAAMDWTAPTTASLAYSAVRSALGLLVHRVR